jgi:hypothetical protein
VNGPTQLSPFTRGAALLVLLAGCSVEPRSAADSSTPAGESAPTRPVLTVPQSNESNGQENTDAIIIKKNKSANGQDKSLDQPKADEQPPPAQPAAPPKPEGERRDGVITADPYNRPAETHEGSAPAEPERRVNFPGSVEIASSPPALPSKPRVAVAFVRGGKLARRPDALRRIEHELGRDATIEALERFDASAPADVGLDELCARAEKQGADLLVLDVRATDDDAEKTTFVLHARAPWKAVALVRPRAAEPTGQELVARLVRFSRTGP